MPPTRVDLPSPPGGHADGHPTPVSSRFLGDDTFAQHADEERGRVTGKSFSASGDARMIAGNVITNTSITGKVGRIEIHDYHGSPATSASQQLSKEYTRVQQWLAPSEQASIHKGYLEQRASETGSWLLEEPELASWFAESPSFLWLHGGVGCGKTILCSSVIEKVHDMVQHDKTAKLCYFFFSFQDGARGDLGALTRSLISQLCDGAVVPVPVLDLYIDCHRVFPPRNPTLLELKSVLLAIIQSLGNKDTEPTPETKSPPSKSRSSRSKSEPPPDLQSFAHIYLIIDALDEVSWSHRHVLLDFFQLISDSATSRLHVLVSSRNEPDILDTFNSEGTRWKNLAVPVPAVNQDIERYINDGIASHRPFRRQSPKINDLIRQTLTNKANGMFRWSALQLSALKRLRTLTPDIIERALERLPEDLNQSYANILSEIDELLVPQALGALQWLVVSKRLLYIEELADACSDALSKLGESRFQFREGTLEPYTFFEMFRDLVTIQPPLPEDSPPEPRCHKIALAHFSVQEFLLQDYVKTSSVPYFAFTKSRAHSKVAQDCLEYLYRFNTPFPFNSLKTRQFDLPLREYAWFNWEKHVIPSDLDEVNEDPARRKATRLFAHFKEHSRWTDDDEPTLSMAWIPPEGYERLLDALKTPYFYPDFERYFSAQSGPREDPRWFGEKQPNPKENEIGLITILPSLDPEEDIRTQLHVVSLEDKPVYKAISYALGPEEDHPIFVGGSKKSVRPYLARIFSHLRLHQEGHQPKFWADVISLEEWQSYQSTYERSNVYYTETRFLVMLKEIFEQAEEVVVGLGDERPDDDAAIALILKFVCLSQKWHREFQELYGSNTANMTMDVDGDFYRAVADVDKRGGWQVLMSLLDREWWRRRWIIQEIVVARSATLFFGNRAFNFDMLDQFVEAEVLIQAVLRHMYTPFGLAYHEFFDSRQWTVAKDISLTRREYKSERTELSKLLWRFRFQAAAYKTDMIRTLVGLCRIREHDDLFKLDLQHALIPAAKQMLSEKSNSTLDILSFNSVYSVWAEANVVPRTWLPALERDASEVFPLVLGIFNGEDSKNVFNACGDHHRLNYKFYDHYSWRKRHEYTGRRISVEGIEVDHIRKVAKPYLGHIQNAQLLEHAKEMESVVPRWYKEKGPG